MKTRLCIAVTALAVSVLAGGWLLGEAPKPDDPPKAKGQLPAHFKKLGLTDKQVQQIYKIQTTYRDKIQLLQLQIDDLRKAEHLDVDDVLTDDQKARLKELLTAEIADKDKPPPAADKDKPTPATDKDKPAPATDKDKPVPATDKDKPTPPATDKDK